MTGKLTQASILQKVNARMREMNRMLAIGSGGVTFLVTAPIENFSLFA
jgi:hypothetical protein